MSVTSGPKTARRWFVNETPKGDLTDTTLVLREEPLRDLEAGEILVRSVYLSLDATNRVWLSTFDHYMPPLLPGDPMRGFLVGEVIESRNEAFPTGSLAVGMHTWSDYLITDGTDFSVYPGVDGLPLSDFFGVMTVAAPTAYHGLIEMAKPQPGETVVVTAAAGAVGALVGQMAKIAGCRVVGVAGGTDKCAYLVNELGFDAAVDYKSEPILEGLERACPDGIDVHFENVGGEALDAGLTLASQGARVIICGLISSYNNDVQDDGVKMIRNMIFRRIRMEGFVILDYLDQYPRYYEAILPWIAEGKLKYRLHVVDGIENALDALKLLYTGGNNGKLMVRIGDEAVRA